VVSTEIVQVQFSFYSVGNCFVINASSRVRNSALILTPCLLSGRQQRSASERFYEWTPASILSFVGETALTARYFRFECGLFSLTICWHHATTVIGDTHGIFWRIILTSKGSIASQWSSHSTVTQCELAILESSLSPVSCFPSLLSVKI